MPELPDVEVFRRHVASTSLHQRIKKASILEQKILKGVSAQSLQRRLKGNAFETTRRCGKHLFIQLDEPKGSDGWLELHFGMTGSAQAIGDARELPRHTRMLIEFEKGGALAIISQRLLGHVSLTDDIGAFIVENDLGPDALDISSDEFCSRIAEKHTSIKAALMDQSTLAGIGNVYSDEILFQAGLHPESRADELSDKQLKNVHRTMHRVLNVAIRHHVNPDTMPRNYLLPHRKEGAECPRCHGRLKKIKVSGRSALFCPSCQKKA